LLISQNTTSINIEDSEQHEKLSNGSVKYFFDKEKIAIKRVAEIQAVVTFQCFNHPNPETAHECVISNLKC